MKTPLLRAGKYHLFTHLDMSENSEKTPNRGKHAGNESYGAADIKRLKGLKAVRERPGMYIGDTNETGLHHCVYEIVDNSIDEALAGYCKSIKVEIHADGSLSVEDDGRGIPVAMHPEEKVPTLELVLTNLHAGGKFDKGAYQVSGGLNGVGAKCVNALSDSFIAEVSREGEVHQMKFCRGEVTQSIKVIGKTKRTGTKITFHPDPEIFVATQEFKYDTLVRRMRELAFLVPGITVEMKDQRTNRADKFEFKEGIAEYVSFLNANEERLFEKPILISAEVDFTDLANPRVMADGEKPKPGMRRMTLDVALQYNDRYDEMVFSYANLINQPEGGTHLSGFRSALTRVINHYAKSNNLIKDKDAKLNGDDMREGLVAVISVKHPDPKFQSQNKTRLTNPEVEGIVTSAEEGDRALRDGTASFVVVIPPDFERDVVRGHSPQILLAADASDPAAAGGAVAAINGIVTTAISETLSGALTYAASSPPPFSVVVHRQFNPEGQTSTNIVPGLLAIILSMTMVMITAVAIVRETERGTMETLISTPVRPGEVMLGKIFPYVFVGYVQTGVFLAAARILFDVPFLGSPLAFFVGFNLYIIVNLALGFLISTIARSQMQAMQISFFTLLPTILLSGFMFPFDGMPIAVQWIAEVLPLTHFVRLIRGVMLRGASLSALWPDVLALIGFTLVMMTLAILRFRKRLD